MPVSSRKSAPKASHMSALAWASGVSVGPGQMALMRMPCFSSGKASRAT